MKSKGKLINVLKVEQILKRVLDDQFVQHKLYKLIYYLKNRWYLYNIKKNIFLVKDPEVEFTQQQLLDMFYWSIVKQHCKEFLSSHWYIGWLKALELNISSFSVPDELSIITTYKQSNEVIMFDKQICYKKYGTVKDNIFALFYTFTKKISINTDTFVVAWLELALLESLYNPWLIHTWYVHELVRRVLREYKDLLDIKIWEKILRKNKHHTSINRLYKIALLVDPLLSDSIKALIKKVSYFM